LVEKKSKNLGLQQRRSGKEGKGTMFTTQHWVEEGKNDQTIVKKMYLRQGEQTQKGGKEVEEEKET